MRKRFCRLHTQMIRRFARLAFFALLAFPGGASADAVADWSLSRGLYQDQCGVMHARTVAPRLKTGTGAMDGAAAGQAVFLSGSTFEQGPIMRYDGDETKAFAPKDEAFPAQWSFVRFGGLERRIPLDAWRGKALLVSLRLKNDGDARAWAAFQIDKRNDTALRGTAQRNAPGAAWQTRQFILDVPDNATDLVVMAGLTGRGRIWLDDLRLLPVGDAGALSPVRRVEAETRTGCIRVTGPVAAMPGSSHSGDSYNYQMYGR